MASWSQFRVAVALLVVAAYCASSVMPTVYSAPTFLKNIDVIAEAAVNLATPFDSTLLHERFAERNRKIAEETPLPKVSNSVDVYPSEMSALFANRLTWTGRPIFQSYSAYTPSLDRLNASFLLGPRGPGTVFFDVDPTDGRLATLEDASSWPILLSAYSITAVGPRFIQLTRRPDARAPSTTPISTSVHRLDESIPVPQADRPVIAQVNIGESRLGKLRAMAWRTPTMNIELTLKNGRTIEHRYVPAMGRNGFIVSPLIDTKSDFVFVAAGDPRAREVKSIRFSSVRPSMWSELFTVTFLKLDVEPQPNAPRAPMAEPVALDATGVEGVQSCVLDAVDNIDRAKVAASYQPSESTVSVRGWFVPDTANKVGPDKVYLEMRSADGRATYYAANSVARADVTSALHAPSMKSPGFAADLDTSTLRGTQALYMIAAFGDKKARCDAHLSLQFKPGS